MTVCWIVRSEFASFLEDHLNREEIISVPFCLDGTGNPW